MTLTLICDEEVVVTRSRVCCSLAFIVVCSRNSFSRGNWECLILEHRVVFQVLSLDLDVPFE